MLKKTIFAAAILVILVILTVAALLRFGSRDRLISAEAAVVLGTEVYASGQPSPRLAARLDKGLELYRAGTVKTIIVSGGMGKSRVDEARAMAAYLAAKGAPASAVIIDGDGANTWKTAQFAAAYLQKEGFTGIIAVSQAFHIHRSVMALKAAGCPEVGWVSPDYWEWRDIYATLREIPATILYWWRYV